MEKKCCKCKEILDESEFHKNCSYCKKCRKIIYAETYAKYSTNMRKRNKEYVENNKEIIKERNKKYREKNKEIISERNKKLYYENLERERERSREYYKNHKEEHLETCKNWACDDKKNRPYIYIWRNLLWRMIRKLKYIKEDRTINILGYSANDLKNHLENLFLEGMSWNNYGEWQIHHIKFVSSFDKDTPPSIVNSLDNLIPLWKKDHKKIHNKYGI